MYIHFFLFLCIILTAIHSYIIKNWRKKNITNLFEYDYIQQCKIKISSEENCSEYLQQISKLDVHMHPHISASRRKPIDRGSDRGYEENEGKTCNMWGGRWNCLYRITRSRQASSLAAFSFRVSAYINAPTRINKWRMYACTRSPSEVGGRTM